MKEIILNTEYTYSQICEIVGWKVTTGNGKKAQIKEIESSFEFYHPINKKTHKEKKSYIFTKQLKDLVEPKHGGVRNTNYIQPMMDYLRMKVDMGYDFKSFTTWFCEDLDLLNRDMYDIAYKSEDEIALFCQEKGISKPQLLSEYISKTKHHIKDMFRKSLNALAKQDMTEFYDGYTFRYKVGMKSRGKFDSDELNEIIQRTETDICNEMQETYNLTPSMKGRQLLFLIYSNKSYKDEFDEKKYEALMADESAVKLMNKAIDEKETDIGDYCGRKYIDEEHPLISYWQSVAIYQIDGLEYDEGIEKEVSNNIRKRVRRDIFNIKWKTKTGYSYCPYDSWEDATDIVKIEKLLFTHFDENFDDGTSLDLAVLDNELKDFLLDDISQNGKSDGFMEIPTSPEDEEELNRLFDRVSIA